MNEKIKEIQESNLPVIIFGARVVAEALYYSCKESGITIECFCDNNTNIIDKKVLGLEIIDAKKLKDKYDDAIFIISSTYIFDIKAQLEEYGYAKCYDARPFLNEFNIFAYEYSEDIEFVDFSVKTCLISHDNFLADEKLYIRSIDLIITEKCSLKCKDCCNLIQYYEDPQDSSLDDIFKSIDTLCSYVDEINEMRLIGGDAFMNKKWHLIIEKLLNESKVKKIVIYANGIIIPTKVQMQYLKSKKVLVIFTEYGELSYNLDKLCTMFSAEGINYHVINIATGWMDAGKINKHNRTDEELKNTLRYCCVKNYTQLSDGKIYRCPFQANAFKLKAIPDYKEEYLDIFECEKLNLSKKTVVSKIKSFLFQKDIFKSCDYCNGREFGVPEDIEPALQTKKPLEYKKYQ